jgi:hypothetical protein
MGSVRKGQDNGLLILISINDRNGVSHGIGLEGDIPDVGPPDWGRNALPDAFRRTEWEGLYHLSRFPRGRNREAKSFHLANSLQAARLPGQIALRPFG